MTIAPVGDSHLVPEATTSRRSFLSAGVTLGAGAGAVLLMGNISTARAAEGHQIKEYDVPTNGITVHVTEMGEGEAVVFCHGFRTPPIRGGGKCRRWRWLATVRSRLTCVATDEARRPRMRLSIPPFKRPATWSVCLTRSRIPGAIIVGHDWGASIAWGAALMRPDRFKAVFCLTVPYVPRGDVSFFEYMRKTGHQNDFYMFEQCKPEADQIWADAATTIPGVLYWASGSAPDGKRWSPMNPARSLHRAAPGPLPSWAEPDYVAFNIAEFQRTGFHGGLNYYRAFEPYFYLSGAYKGAKITQPSFYMSGKSDGLNELYPLSEQQIRAGLPGLVGLIEIDNVGHWVQHEASAEVSKQLVQFVRTVLRQRSGLIAPHARKT
jgi:pimeloyl-ACP methyl ester carboxylesterase